MENQFILLKATTRVATLDSSLQYLHVLRTSIILHMCKYNSYLSEILWTIVNMSIWRVSDCSINNYSSQD